MSPRAFLAWLILLVQMLGLKHKFIISHPIHRVRAAGFLAVVLAGDLIVTVRPEAIRSETVGSRATFDRRSQVAGPGGTLSAKLGMSVVRALEHIHVRITPA
jgi:hypothetical protein